MSSFLLSSFRVINSGLSLIFYYLPKFDYFFDVIIVDIDLAYVPQISLHHLPSCYLAHYSWILEI